MSGTVLAATNEHVIQTEPRPNVMAAVQASPALVVM